MRERDREKGSDSEGDRGGVAVREREGDRGRNRGGVAVRERE